MKYYRLIFKQDTDGVCVFTDIMEQEMDQLHFEQMTWEKPIIRHVTNDHVHFISLERNFLEAMILGITTLKDIEAMPTTSSQDNPPSLT